MTTVNFGGETWTLPYNGRFTAQIQHTLAEIIRHPSGIALYAAMGLRGRAKAWYSRYAHAFTRFAEANGDKLKPGHVGVRGGWGYRYHPGDKIEENEK